MNIGCSWSGGKDSCYALMIARQQGHQLKAVINMMNEHGRSPVAWLAHLHLLQRAEAMNFPRYAIYVGVTTNFIYTITEQVKKNFEVEGMVFSDSICSNTAIGRNGLR